MGNQQRGQGGRNGKKHSGPLTFGRWALGAIIASALGASIAVGYLYSQHKTSTTHYATAHHETLSSMLTNTWIGFFLLFIVLCMGAALIVPSFRGKSSGGTQASNGWGAWGN